MNLENYLPVLLFILVGMTVGVFSLLMGRVLGPYKPDKAKNAAYECGFEAFDDARIQFDVRFYLVAILFILFDLEIAFLFPWAAAMGKLNIYAFCAVMVFILELAVGFWYVWKKGALDWE